MNKITENTFRDWLYDNARTLSSARDRGNLGAKSVGLRHREYLISNDQSDLQELLKCINQYLGLIEPEPLPIPKIPKNKYRLPENRVINLREKCRKGESVRNLAREFGISQKGVKFYLAL